MQAKQNAKLLAILLALALAGFAGAGDWTTFFSLDEDNSLNDRAVATTIDADGNIYVLRNSGDMILNYWRSRGFNNGVQRLRPSGQLVRTLHNNDQLKPGYYNILWNCRDNRDRQVSNGVYFYRLIANDKLQITAKPAVRIKTRKLVIAK